MEKRRLVWWWDNGVGPTFVHLTFGVRVTVADTAFAFFLGLGFGELAVQWNRKEQTL